MDMDRLKLLEQQVNVLQREVNAVLEEVQTALTLMAKSTQTALSSLQNQIIVLNDKVDGKIKSGPQVRMDDGGKEL